MRIHVSVPSLSWNGRPEIRERIGPYVRPVRLLRVWISEGLTQANSEF